MAVLGVAAVAFIINLEYRRNAEERLSELLVANVFALMGSVNIDDTGAPAGFP